ncbi:MAG: hypothetical protein J6B02_03020 [Selenomonadales bacterium]|nr:hypothetical protein [Selenomonadales bacterium]
MTIQGYGGSARLVLEDEETLIYEYMVYYYWEPEYKNEERIYDGLIMISKDAFIEPELREVIKKKPKGKQESFTVRIHRHPDYDALFKEKKLAVENSRFCRNYIEGKICDYEAPSFFDWPPSSPQKPPETGGIGDMAMWLIKCILGEYQWKGTIPKIYDIRA